MPIIALVFGAIASGNSDATWYVAPMFYFMGVIAIIISGIMLKKTKLFAGETTPFIMELPQYHGAGREEHPALDVERVKATIKAGTIIFLSTIVIWFLMNFGDAGEGFGLLDSEAPDYMEYSLMAASATCWPDLRAAWLRELVATATAVTGLVAKGERRRDRRHHHPARRLRRGGPAVVVRLCSDARWVDRFAIVAFCAFNLLCAPCFAAMGTIRQQQRSAKWFDHHRPRRAPRGAWVACSPVRWPGFWAK